MSVCHIVNQLFPSVGLKTEPNDTNEVPKKTQTLLNN